MDSRMKDIEEIAKAKAAARRRRAGMSFVEKIRILVRLQQRRAPILASRGKKQRVWRIEDGEAPPKNTRR
jgi:hypothetical protein